MSEISRMRFLAAILFCTVLVTRPAFAESQEETYERMQKAAGPVAPARAESCYAALGVFLPTTSDSFIISVAHLFRMRSAVFLGHMDSVIAQADSAAQFQPYTTLPLVECARALTEAHQHLDVAETLARRAVNLTLGRASGVNSVALATLGRVQIERGDPEAVETLKNALSVAHRDSQWVLYWLGRAYEKAGKADQAIDAFVRSESVFGEDSSYTGYVAERVDSLYRLGHGSLEGLEELRRKAREDSRANQPPPQIWAGRPAADWRLVDMRTGRLRSESVSRDTWVLDFWATWCAPCVRALPEMQVLADEYRGRPVHFTTFAVMDRRKDVLQFIREKHLTLPVFAADSAVVARYGARAYPTTVIVQAGTIVFSNAGTTTAVATSLVRAQVDSLLAVARTRLSRKTTTR